MYIIEGSEGSDSFALGYLVVNDRAQIPTQICLAKSPCF